MAVNTFSLYTKDSIDRQREFNTITIIIPDSEVANKNGEPTAHSGTIIKGLMQDNFSYGLTAEWAQVFKAGGYSDVLETAMLVTGNKVQNAGGITKQYYKGSDYVTIPVKFRIYAGEDPSPLQVVSALSRLAVPGAGASIKTFINNVIATGTKGKALIEQLGGDLLGGKGTITALNDFFNSLTSDVGNTVCTVRFGKWMTGQFVLTDVKFEYSKEISFDEGPYYVDIDATFKSLMIPTKDSFNLGDSASVYSVRLLDKTKPRVTVNPGK